MKDKLAEELTEQLRAHIKSTIEAGIQVGIHGLNARANLCFSVLEDFSDSALSDGVVGEMVEWMKELKVCGDMLIIDEDMKFNAGRLSSILAKLEGNDG